MLPKPLRLLWGDLNKAEIERFGILAATFFWIIGTYWMLRVMKNPVFDLLVGFGWQPVAKIASLLIIVPMVLLYSKLVDVCHKITLFYIVCSFFGLGFLATAFLLAFPAYAVAPEGSVLALLFAWVPGRVLGWFVYIFVESLGSILPALFWAFVSSTTTTESAKRGYGMIMSCTQFGVILGPLFVVKFSKTLGLPWLFACGAFSILLMPLAIKAYTWIVPADLLHVQREKQRIKTGLFEGLRLLFSKTYLLGVFVVSTTYEIISTVIEYQANMLAATNYPTKLDGGVGFAWFESWIAIGIGTLALLFALVGTSFFLRTLGLRFCLMSFPITIGAVLVGSFMFYFFGASLYTLMWVFFASIVVIKGLNYALNVPSREVLYIPTSRDVRFKAKGWIDGFGNRTTKAAGSTMTGLLGGSLSKLIVVGTALSLVIVISWTVVAAFVGNTFNTLEKEDKIIE